MVTGDVVRDNGVVGEGIAGRMAVERNAGEAVVKEFIVDDHIAGNEARSAPVGEKANSCTRPWNLKSVMYRPVIGNRVVNDAQVWSG